MRLRDLAQTIRSKNAGPFWVTLDVIFDEPAAYARACRCGALSRERIAALYRMAPEQVSAVHHFDAGQAIKVSLARDRASGAPGDSDVYGAQQYAPLLDVEIPDEIADETPGQAPEHVPDEVPDDIPDDS